MPKAVAMSMTLPNTPGVEVSINYNSANRREDGRPINIIYQEIDNASQIG